MAKACVSTPTRFAVELGAKFTEMGSSGLGLMHTCGQDEPRHPVGGKLQAGMLLQGAV